MPKLTRTFIASLKPEKSMYRIADYVPGLYIRMLPSNSLTWEFRYSSPIDKKRKWHVIGYYKKKNSDEIIISIEEARNRAEKLAKLVEEGNDPAIAKVDLSFGSLYQAWQEKREEMDLNKKYVSAMHSAMTRFILPSLAKYNVDEIKPFMIADALREIEKNGKFDTLSKVKSNLNLIFSDFVVRGYIHENTAGQIPRSAFKTKESTPQRHLSLDQIYLLHHYFNNENASYLIRLCTEFIARTGLRASEACCARWDEYDEKYNVLSIYKGRMKNRKEHLVPLSSQSIKIIEELKKLGTDKSNFLFFDPTSKTGYINPEAPRNSLDNFKVPTSAHGLRHLFSTLLNEVMTFESDLIESCLSHSPKNIIRATYNKANLVLPMREVFQEYSDHLDKCKTEELNKKWLEDNNIILLNSK